MAAECSSASLCFQAVYWTTVGFGLTRLFFLRSFQVRPGPPKVSWRWFFGACWCEIFCWLYDLPVTQPMKKTLKRRRKHCALAVVRRSLNFRPAADPLPGGAGRPKFLSPNQLLPSLWCFVLKATRGMKACDVCEWFYDVCSFVWQMCSHTARDKQGQHGSSHSLDLFTRSGRQEECAHHRRDCKWWPLISATYRFNGHFPCETGLAGVYWSKGWWNWRWQLEL